MSWNVEPLLRPVPILNRQHLHTTDQPRLLHQPCECTHPDWHIGRKINWGLYLTKCFCLSVCVFLDHLSYFHFVGRVMGLAVFHGHYINGSFTLPFYKQLLGKPIQLNDLETTDPELHKSLVWILWVTCREMHFKAKNCIWVPCLCDLCFCAKIFHFYFCLWHRENDITSVLDHTFCVEHNAFGKFLQHELKPNGRNIPVTEENKKEYVR